MISTETLEKLEFSKVTGYISKYCITENGKEKISFLRPYSDVKEAVKDGKRVNEAKEILIKNEIPPLDYLPDLNETLSRSRIEGTVLAARNILEVLKLAETSRKLFQYLKSHGSEVELLSELRESLFVDKVFEHQISKVFTESGEIKDDATPRLREIRNDIRDKETQLRKMVNGMLKQLSDSYLVQEEYITLRDGRIVLPVKAEHKRHVRGFVHSESATGQTVYIEPAETLELNNEILSLTFAEKREIEKILKNLTEKIGGVSSELKTSLSAISELDSIFARAKYSLEIIGAIPTFDERRAVELIEARHPILLKKLGFTATIPLNIKMQEEAVILITGPNAGGKTVTLKTMGLVVLLAQSGIPVPIHPDSNLHFFNNVLVDIGDAQSIEDDLSTFSSHLTNIKNIIDHSGSKVLVLLDEVGTGTDPTEGSAIATGFLVTLRDKGAKVLATTHHGSLKILANQLDKFQNASMEFDTDNLKPTYRFNQGIPGSSYAFEVAGRIGFDVDFINLSKTYLDKDKSKIEDFLANLEIKSKDLRDQLKRLEIENSRLKGLTNLYQEKVDKLEKQKKEILQETREKAEIYLKDINKKIENAVKNIRESNARKDVVKKEKEVINTLKSDAEKVFKKEKVESTVKVKLKTGDYASIRDTNSAGVIDEINIEKDKAVLTIGSLKIKARYSDLVPAKKKDFEEAKYFKHDIISDQNYRLDIRGKRIDEAELEILKFLDAANMNGYDRVEILHGKGTGALKQLVQGTLKNYKFVKYFYFANIESGGDGITIVEFK
ncbi:MAG TPA: endonuclease MutS2 [Melioribacteraceae bacterium]|nr:endonuclease MutS2 [Melioribacteraceae bacterium]